MRTTLKTICLTLLAAAALTTLEAPPAEAQTPFEPAAVVNDQAITRFELDQRLRAQSALTGVEINSAVASSILGGMISDRLRLQAAASAGITVSDVQIDSGVSAFAAQSGMTVEEMNARLRGIGVSPKTIRDLVEAEIAWREVIRRRYGARARASEADVERELELLDLPEVGGAESASGAIYEVGFLSVALDATASAEEVLEASAQLRSARTTVSSCEELAAISNEFGPGSGVRSDVTIADLPAPLNENVPGLVPGQFTDPVRLVDAVVIALLCSVETQSASGQRVEEVRRELVRRNFERYADAYLQELRRDAVIEVR